MDLLAERKFEHSLSRKAKRKHLRIAGVKGYSKTGTKRPRRADSNIAKTVLTSTKARESSLIIGAPDRITRSPYKRLGVLRKKS